jgi:hypothetical protein
MSAAVHLGSGRPVSLRRDGEQSTLHYIRNGVFRAGNDFVAEKNQHSVTHKDVDALKPLNNNASATPLRT